MTTILLAITALVGCKGEDPNTVDCTAYGLDIPSVRAELSGVWDEERQRLVFFGGNQDVPVDCAFGATDFVDDTWEFNRECGAFRNLEPGDPPTPRGRHSSTTDGAKMYIAHGRFREGTTGNYTMRRDLWAYDFAGNTWERLSAGAGPAARANSAMIHLDGKLWVFGGNTSANGGSFNPQNDLWTYDLASGDWTEIEPAGPGPSPREFHGMTTDGEMIYVFGGGDENAFLGPFLEDLWAYDPQTNRWTEMPHSGGLPSRPSDRFWASLDYDAVGQQLVLFGGHDNTNLGNTNQVYKYVLAEGRWRSEREGDVFNSPSNGFCDFPADFVTVDVEAPERRNAHASAITPQGDVLIFGGKTDCGLINDVWSYSMANAAWTEESAPTSGEACVRANQNCSSLCF